MRRLFIFLLLLIAVPAAHASIANVYVAQVAAGAANGSSCANAQGLTFFNTAANWGSGTSQIGAGTTVHLCGTITSALVAQGNGASGSPVVILFDPGANITVPVLPTSGIIVLTGRSNITVDGGSTVVCGFVGLRNVPCNNGVIQATANGTNLANKVGSAAILADNTTNVEIRNLVIANVYVHVSGSSDAPPRSWCVHAYGTISGLNIHNNTMHDVAWCVDGFGSNSKFENNEVYNMDHGLGYGGPITSGTISIDNNHYHDMVVWDETSGSYHHDGVHGFTDNGALTATTYWYDNICDGDIGNSVTACFYREASSGAFQPFYAYNNVGYFLNGPGNVGRNSCCGNINLYTDGGTSNSGYMFNNTTYGPGMFATSINGSQGLVRSGQTGALVKNNVWGAWGGPTTQNVFGVDNGASFISGGLATNAYINVGSSNAFSWHGSSFGSFSTWVSDSGETGALFLTQTQMALSTTTGQPASTSSLCAAGTNLTSVVTGLGLPGATADIAGNARPATGNWDMGAFNCASSGPAPAVSLSPTSVAFGNQTQSTTSPAQTVTLTNTGTATLSIVVISFTGTNAGDFGDTTTCGSTLAAGASCAINVTFTPATTSAETASLQVASNATTSPNAVPLTGTGVTAPAPAASFSPTFVNFGNVTQGTTSVLSTTLTNTGTATLSITNTLINGTNAADFRQTATTCGTTLTSSSSCTFTFTFTPSLLTQEAANFFMADNASGSPHLVTLGGTGTAAPAPVISLSPTSLTYASQGIGSTSASQSVTVTNTGNASATFTSVTLTGTNAANFNLTNGCTGSLAAGSSCSFSVTFSPTAVGTATAAVSLADSASNSPQTVSLSGAGVIPPAPGISFSPTSVAFGNQPQGVVSSGTPVVITSSGTAALTVTSVSITGTNAADFAQTNNCPSSLAVLATCTVTVKFTPSVLASESASISVVDSASGSPHTVALTGTGVAAPAPTAVLSPTSLGFGTLTEGQTSAVQTITLTNGGSAALTITSITITGTNAADFAQTNNCGASLAASNFCTVSLTFKPSIAGSESASLSVSDNASGSPQTAALSGTGQVPSPPVPPSGLKIGPTNPTVLLTQ